MTDQPRWEAPETPVAPSGTPFASGERPLPLRQMGIGEIIDGAVKLYRRDWLALMAIVALVLVPVTFVQIWFTQSLIAPLASTTATPSEEAIYQALVAFGIVFVIQFLLVQPFLLAAITRAAADAYLGERVSIGRTFQYALRRLPAILWITILSGGAAIVAGILGFVVIVLGAAISDAIGVGVVIIGVVLLIVLPTLIFIRLSLAPPVVVVEDVRGTKAVGRSWRLTKGHFWRLLGLLVLATLIGGVAAAIITIPTEALAAALGAGGWPVSAIGQSLASVLITPFSILIIVLFYFDMRIRKEGFDIEVMAQELGPSS